MALSALVEKGASVIDVGTDHGFLPVFLAQSGTCPKIYASDISAASLAAALRSAEKFNVSDDITFLVTSGLDGITPEDVNTIIIAGLGGETILSILEKAPWTKYNNITLILQPQSKVDLLFRFLYDNGYKIIQTQSVIDKSKHYTVILAKGDKKS